MPWYFDDVLPPEVAISSLDPNVGWDPVDPAWVNITTPGRQKILIPWAEDDPGLAGPELWVERVLHHAKTGSTYGCNGLLAVHWRTSEVVPEFAALYAAAWDDAASVESVYTDWATANFGPEVAAQIAHLFVSLDSFSTGDIPPHRTGVFPGTATNLPRVTQSCCGKFGPCFDMKQGASRGKCKADSCNGFAPNSTCAPVHFGFVNTFRELAPRVRGAANRARFSIWHNSFEYFGQLVEVELAATKLIESMTNLSNRNSTISQKRAIGLTALQKLRQLSRAWENMTSSLQQTVMSSGTLGTLATNDANMYIRNFPFNSTKTTLEALGIKVSKDALPRAEYSGPDRLFVRTVRTTILLSEGTLNIQATLLTKQATYSDDTWEVVLHHRMLAQNPQPWTTMLLSRVPGRGVFNAQISIGNSDFEWWISAKDAKSGSKLVFPAGYIDAHETVTVIVVDDSVR